MTHLERVAIRRALDTADFSRSPGLRDRLRHSLRHPPERHLLVLLVVGIGFWILAGWVIFG